MKCIWYDSNMKNIHKTFFTLLVSSFVFAGCGDSDSNGGGANAGDACAATAVAEFFEAIAGDIDFTATDTFAENGDPATTDDSFVDGETYTVSFDDTPSATVTTENGDETFAYDEAQNDLFDASENEINVLMIRNGVRFLIQQPCDDPSENLFILYSADGVNPPVDFAWRLDS